MQRRWPEFEAFRAQALVISFATPDRLADYRASLELSFPIGSDPERRAYRAYGLTRGTFAQIWAPSTLWTYVKLLLKGRTLKQPTEGDDLSQLGGDFIVGPAADGTPGSLCYAHVSRTAVDRPTASDLLAALAAL